MLQGDLALFSLGEIFQSLAINTHTGTLKITSRGSEDKLVCFYKGEIVYLSDDSPSVRVPRIGEILLRTQVITQGQLEEALAEQRETKQYLGEILVKKGVVSTEDLKTALGTQTLEGLYDLFLLREGTFEFHMNEIPDALKEGIQKSLPIALNTNSVIMEGLRQIDEWGVIQKRIATFDEVFKRIDVTEAGPTDASGLLLDMINGARPVKDLFKSYPGSRFECAKKLCEFLDKGLIRALTAEECHALARERSEARQFTQAAAYLQFTVQLSPESGSLYEELGEALSSAYQDEASKAAFLNALRRHYEKEDFHSVATLGEKLLPRMSLEDGDLEKLFFSFVRLQNFKRAASAGNQLVASHQRKGQFEEAAIIMEAIAAMDPRDLNLKIQAATLFEKAGNTLLATRELEEVASTLEREKKYRELIKILRLLSQMNPKRQDLVQKIGAIQSLVEKIARRKKYGITIAGITCISLLVFAVVPLLYEVKAREYFSHAQRVEQTAMLSMDFKRAKEAYLAIVKNYCFSTKVAEAQEALGRISTAERSFITRLELEAAVRKEEHESKIFAMREQLAAKIREAEGAEKSGDIHRAHGIYKQLTVDYSEIPATKNILLPLRITSDPAGAAVMVDGTDAGKTPVIHRYKPGTTINLTLSRSSCETNQQALDVSDQWEVHIKLKRRPLAELSAVPTIQQPMALCQRNLIVASRDGNLYALDPRTKHVFWQRTVGRFGDRISNVEVRAEEILLGTVTGEVTAIAASSGKSRWIARLGSSILAAPAASPDGKWVAVATTAGWVYLLSNENGAIAAKFSTENEVVTRPLFAGSLLIVGSTDNYVYGFSQVKQAVELERELSDDIVFDPALDGNAVLFATSNGTVYRLDAGTFEVLWSQPLGHPVATPPAPSATGIHLGTGTGKVITLDRRTGEVAWEATVGKGAVTGMALSNLRIYASLDTGKIVAIDMTTRKVAWDYQSDMSLAAPPLLSEGVLYLGGVSGKIQYLEVLE